jgi:hypothetical protein
VPIVVQWSKERGGNQNDQREEECAQEVKDQVPCVQEDEEDDDEHDHMIDRGGASLLSSQLSTCHTAYSVPTYMQQGPGVPRQQHTNKPHQMRERGQVLLSVWYIYGLSVS